MCLGWCLYNCRNSICRLYFPSLRSGLWFSIVFFINPISRLLMKRLNTDTEVVPNSIVAVWQSDHHVLPLVMAPYITLNHLKPILHIHLVSKLPFHEVLSRQRYVVNVYLYKSLVSGSHCMFNIDFCIQGLLLSAFEDPNPTVIFEPKILYR